MRFPENSTDYLGTVRFTPEDRETPDRRVTPIIELYLPTSLQFGDKVEYENTGLGALGATAADAYRSDPENRSSMVGSYVDAFREADNKMLEYGVAQLVNQFSSKAGAATREATRVAPNPNTRAIFKQVNLRQFQMTFKLIPNSESEARTIADIIKEFRTNMYPEEIEGNFGYKFPTRYYIEAFYGEVQLEGIKTEPCYLESIMTNYNPSSHAFMKSGSGRGYFSEIDLSLTFIEGKTLNRESVKAGY